MGRVFPAVAVVAAMMVVFLSSSHCRASILMKANASCGCGGGGECLGISEAVAAEFMVGSHVARFLDFEDNKPKTDETKNPNVQTCPSGAGNAGGACNGDPNSKKDCPKYTGSATC